MACRKLIITDKLPDHTKIDSLFIENEDIVYYKDMAECISKLNYYISEEGKKEAQEIANNGYNKVINNHTQIKRVDVIYKNYLRWKESSL
jgi:spore maturation protein CgeB